MYRILGMLMHTQFAQQMVKMPRIKGGITKTNVLKKNPDYRKIVALLEFLKGYEEIGYTIRVIEQNPQINEVFERDIYHSILFNYLILKGYLEDEKDRKAPAPVKTKKRSLKPKFIKEIIEELTEDYDLPDIEIRKVLIEELTREQLMLEEEAERRRLVEEQEKRKREEEERLRLEKEAEEERLRKEKEAEEERLRQEQEAEERRKRAERMEQEAEDRRRSKLFTEEITYFKEHLQEKLEARENALARQIQAQKDAEDAALLMDEFQKRRLEAEAREKKRLEEEKERQLREKYLAEAKERIEEENRREQELREQDQKDTEATMIYFDELVGFKNTLSLRIAMREAEAERIQQERKLREEERQRRMAAAGYN
jgi:hypothetical protein